jgi:hypothetical protein
MSVGFGIVVLLLLPPVPEKIRWEFSKQEKKILVARSKEAYNTIDAKINSKQLVSLAKEAKTYLFGRGCSISTPRGLFSD